MRIPWIYLAKVRLSSFDSLLLDVLVSIHSVIKQKYLVRYFRIDLNLIRIERKLKKKKIISLKGTVKVIIIIM